ncbi:hypothetical protein Bestia_00049 [Acinetobacter phage Bestia]|nr:hypothetical protein Bestia_00049 [Acinetobacter phage Bestia]
MEKITAKEARKMADSFDEGNTEADLEECYKNIKSAANSGAFSISLDKKVTKRTLEELREAGYTAFVLTGKTHISWFVSMGDEE